MASSSTKDLTKKILDYFTELNRPCSINEISEKFDKDTKKAAIQKAVDCLVNKENLTEKQYGKQKIYFPKQADKDENYQSIRNEIACLERKVTTLQENLNRKQDKMKELETESKKFSSLPSLKELENREKNLKDNIKELQKTLENFTNSEEPGSSKKAKLSAEDIEKINRKHEREVSIYRKRKRLCLDMLDAILEGYPKTKKQLIQEIPIETDEDANFQLK